MRYLIVAHLTADSPELRRWLEETRDSDAGFSCVLLVPTAPRTYWKTWDVLRDLRAAEERAERARQLFEEAQIPVERVVIGSREPLAAIEDELREDREFDAVVIATLPPGLSRWLGLDLISQCRRRTGKNVVHVVARAPGTEEARTTAPAGARSETGPTERTPSGASARRDAAALVAEEQPSSSLDLPAPGQAMGMTPTRLARTFAQTPELAGHYWALHTQIETNSGLSPELGELVALRVACRQRFAELWQEHVRIARALGIADTRVAALEHWGSSEHVRFDERERAVLGYVDAVCEEGNSVVPARDVLERHLDHAQVVALTLMIGFYRMSGAFAHALGLGTDEPFVGWSLFGGEGGEQHL